MRSRVVVSGLVVLLLIGVFNSKILGGGSIANIIDTFAGGGRFPIPPVSDPLQLSIDMPQGIFINATGGANYDVYIASQGDGVVRKISNIGTITIVAGVLGSTGYNGDNQNATDALIGGPTGVVVDSAGNIYIADP